MVILVNFRSGFCLAALEKNLWAKIQNGKPGFEASKEYSHEKTKLQFYVNCGTSKDHSLSSKSAAQLYSRYGLLAVHWV